MRILFVSPAGLADPQGGRAMLARLHLDALRSLPDSIVTVYQLNAAGGGALDRLRGFLDGATPSGIAGVIGALDDHVASAVWLDGSNLGRIAKAVRRYRQGVRIFTFCHNVEATFFLGALRRARNVHAAGVFAGNYVAERLAIQNSDDIVALSDRDSAGLKRIYGRGADHLLPMALTDQTGGEPSDNFVTNDAPLLFVGGSFYANRAGIAWFARHVAPHIPTRVQVIGQGMDTMRAELGATPTIDVIGTVGSLEPYYRVARAAIAPIFDGSGMKTKVAEALMFGKHVVGTPEAFSGYADDVVAANYCCTDADAFVAAITAATAKSLAGFDPAMRAFFDRDHSPAAARVRLASILGIG